MSLMRTVKSWFTKRTYFKGADVNRLLNGWIMSPVSIDRALYADSIRLRTRARELEWNSPHVRQYLTLLADNVVGPQGFKLQAQVRNNSTVLNRPFNTKIEEAWTVWSKSCTIDGRTDLTEVSQLIIRSVARDGEAFIRLVPGADNPFAFALQVMDADLIDETYNRPAGENGPEIRLGVEITQYGKPLAYHVWSGYEDAVNGTSGRKRERIPADQVIHLFRADRPGQTRGYTWLAAIMQPLRILDGYVEAELVAARTGAAKMGFLKPSPEVYDPPARDATVVPSMEGDAGRIPVLPPGVDFEPWSPDHPSTSFPTFVKAVLRQIASGLSVSYNALTNDLEGVNYSSIRSGLLIERDHWRALQYWWIARFLTPVYEQWVRYALLSGALVLDSRDPKKFLDVKFFPRGWAWVDPLKDAQAAILQIDAKLGTRSEALAEKGTDFESVCETLEAEKALLSEYDLEDEPEPAPALTLVKPPEKPKMQEEAE